MFQSRRVYFNRWVVLLGLAVSVAALADIQVMNGHHVRISVDLDRGFYEESAAYRGQYRLNQEVLGIFRRDPSPKSGGMPILLEVTSRPIRQNLAQWESWVLHYFEGRFEKRPTTTQCKSPPGFWVAFWEARSTAHHSIWNLYFETVQHGQGIQFRFYTRARSPVEDLSGIKEIAFEVVHSLRVEPVPQQLRAK